MATYFGSGEYELKETKVKRSTSDARLRFWRELANRKPDILRRLLQWFDPHHRPHNTPVSIQRYQSSIASILGGGPSEEPSPDSIPLQLFVLLVLQKKEDVFQLMKDVEAEIEHRQELWPQTCEIVLNRFLPGWEDLRLEPAAHGWRMQ